jgi:hypothetical protein
MSKTPGGRRFAPDPSVLALVERYGAPRVGIAYGLDGDAIRRYQAGASQRATRWWIECNATAVERDLAAEDVGRTRDQSRPSMAPGEGL